MERKRKLAVVLACIGLAFVGVFHTVLAFAFGTGLEFLGVGLAVLSLGIALVVGLAG